MASKFDPEGGGYDIESAIAAGIRPDETGHWPSRHPMTGQILKGRLHPTWDKHMQADAAMGYVLTKGKDGKYYSYQSTQTHGPPLDDPNYLAPASPSGYYPVGGQPRIDGHPELGHDPVYDEFGSQYPYQPNAPVSVAPVGGREGRPYPGYEDYSPQGRAAAQAFTDAGGWKYIQDEDPVKPYIESVDIAREAARKEIDRQRKLATREYKSEHRKELKREGRIP